MPRGNSRHLFLKNKRNKKMLRVKVKKIVGLSIFLFAISSVLFATNSYALFENLTESGGKIFLGMRDIIYAVSGFGIIAIAIGGFFGNFNWKWLSAIIIGLMVIALMAGILAYMTDTSADSIASVTGITDSLITAE